MKDDSHEFSHDLYQTTELCGGVKIGKRIQFTAFLPYNSNQQVMEGHTHAKKGAGVAVKLPTGAFAPNLHHHPVTSAKVQPGTGTADFILNAGDEINVGKWKVSNNVNYKISGQAKGFRFGNRLHVSSIVSRALHAGKNTLTPFAGLNYERNEISKVKSEAVAFSNGYGLFGATGVDVNLIKISTGVICQLPVVQCYAAPSDGCKDQGHVASHIYFLERDQ